MKTLKIKELKDIPKNFTGIVEWDNGDKIWYKEGKRHKTDGPAVESLNGYKEWWIDGKIFESTRLNFLIEKSLFLGTEKGKYNLPWLRFLTEDEGIKEFPIIPSMENYFYLSVGLSSLKPRTGQQNMDTIKLKNNERIPKNYTGIVEWEDGYKEWRKEGIIHREDGPAVEKSNGTKYWYKNGTWHRTTGPAIEYYNGSKLWHLDGNIIRAKDLKYFIENMIYLGTEKGKYNLYWLKFLSETQGIKEFPIIPGMEKDEGFKPLFETLGI